MRKPVTLICNEDYNYDAWFDPSNNEEVWYIGTHVQNFDIKLESIKLPKSEITRTSNL